MNYDRTPFDLTLGRIPLTLQYDVLFISFLIAQSAQNSLENGCNKPKPDINHDVIFLIELNWWEEKGGGESTTAKRFARQQWENQRCENNRREMASGPEVAVCVSRPSPNAHGCGAFLFIDVMILGLPWLFSDQDRPAAAISRLFSFSTVH